MRYSAEGYGADKAFLYVFSEHLLGLFDAQSSFGFAAAFNQTEMGRQQGERTRDVSKKCSWMTYDVIPRWQGNWVGSCTRKADR